MRQAPPVSEKFRVASVVGLVLVSALGWLFAIVAGADMIHRGSPEFEGKPLWLGVVIVAMLAFIADWLAWRVSNPKVGVNGPTAIPAWFVRLFGGFGLLGGGWIMAFDSRVPLISKLLSVPAAVAVIFVLRTAGRNGRRNQR